MRTLDRLPAMLAAVLALAAAGPAGAEPHGGKARAATVAAREKADKHGGKGKGGKGKAQSIGAPNAGHLAGAARLPGSKHLELRQGAHSWGLPQLVHLLKRAADAVGKAHKGSTMLVGDLSGREGGFLPGHNSHQSGRDADIGFYVMNVKGKPVHVKHFVAFDGAGRGRELPWAVFDDARNWALVEVLLREEHPPVRFLFITLPLRARLLAFGAKKHAPRELLARAAAAMLSPQDADVHDDHFHVRLSCPEAMRDTCIEESTPRSVGPAGGGGDDKGPASTRPGDGDATGDPDDRATARTAGSDADAPDVTAPAKADPAKAAPAPPPAASDRK